jgi:hypothetical protein
LSQTASGLELKLGLQQQQKQDLEHFQFQSPSPPYFDRQQSQEQERQQVLVDITLSVRCLLFFECNCIFLHFYYNLDSAPWNESINGRQEDPFHESFRLGVSDLFPYFLVVTVR